MDNLQPLKKLNQWTCWRTPRGRKVPYNPQTARNAQSNNPRTWVCFDAAWAGTKRGLGLGFFFNNNGIVGIDLDKCIVDGVVAEWAAEIVAQMDSYTEFSPSGNGLHIFVYGKLEKNVKHANKKEKVFIEVYDRLRFFTITEKPYLDVPIRSCQDELDALVMKINPPRPQIDFSGVKIEANDGIQKYIRDWCLSELGGAVDGNKYNTLTRVAYTMGGYVSGGYVDFSDAKAWLTNGVNAMQNVQDYDHAYKALESCLRSGLDEPIFVKDTKIQFEIGTNVKMKHIKGKVVDKRTRKYNGNWHIEHKVNGVWIAGELLEVV